MRLEKGIQVNAQYCETCQVVVQYMGPSLKRCPEHNGPWTNNLPTEIQVSRCVRIDGVQGEKVITFDSVLKI
jgi:hypothetical protein